MCCNLDVLKEKELDYNVCDESDYELIYRDIEIVEKFFKE